MKQELNFFIKHLYRFGILSGILIYFKNKRTRGESVISLKHYPHNIRLRRSSSDIGTFHQVFLNLEYQYNIPSEPGFIIDCGANIGLASVYFKNRYPKSLVVAVEPEPSNYDMLLKNTQSYSQVECIRAGVWNRNAILKVEDEHSFGHWGFVCKEVSYESENTVRAIAIDEIMAKYGQTEIGLLKIDIEGAELELFAANYEAWLPKTKVIMIELHDWVRRGCSRSFFSALLHYDFSVFHNGENIICIRNEQAAGT